MGGECHCTGKLVIFSFSRLKIKRKFIDFLGECRTIEKTICRQPCKSLFILPEDLQNIPGNLSGKPMEIFEQMV